jgi:hypothetical protein
MLLNRIFLGRLHSFIFLVMGQSNWLIVKKERERERELRRHLISLTGR